jgi:hypothetical protein
MRSNMNDSEVVHHVDYRSKADLRKKELEDLRKRSTVKPHGMFQTHFFFLFPI